MLTIFTRHRHALALTAAAASWGFATAITKHAVNEIPPTTLLPLQLASSLLVLGPLVLFRVNRGRGRRSCGGSATSAFLTQAFLMLSASSAWSTSQPACRSCSGRPNRY